MSTVTVHREDDWTLVRLSGDLDFESAPRLAEMLALIDGPLVVDCTDLNFSDTAGLRVLARAVDWHGSVTLRNPAPFIVRTLELLGWDKALRVEVDARNEVQPI